MFKISFALIVILIAGFAQAQTKPTIICKYPTGQTLLYEAPGNINITYPTGSGYGGLGRGTIPLFVNKVGPILHNLKTFPFRASYSVIYTHKDQFHVNDIEITYVLDQTTKKEFVTGTHKTDYNLIKLACVVKH